MSIETIDTGHIEEAKTYNLEDAYTMQEHILRNSYQFYREIFRSLAKLVFKSGGLIGSPDTENIPLGFQ